jgi:hypothetical protein
MNESQTTFESTTVESLCTRPLCQAASLNSSQTTMVGATSTQIMEIVCLGHANLYDKRIQLTSLASLGIGMTP